MKNIELGIVTVKYNESGNPISSEFTSTMNIQADEKLLKELSSIKSEKDTNLLKGNADLTMGAWFAELTNIELNENGKIVSEVVNCWKYRGGNIRTCVIKYTYVEN